MAVYKACYTSSLQFLYDLELPLLEKMNTIVKKIYGGEGVEVTEAIARQIENLELQVGSCWVGCLLHFLDKPTVSSNYRNVFPS